jgi:Tfp pilus assembly ATPase PilU
MQELISTEEGMRRIPEIVKKSEQLGMQSFDSETLKLYRAGIIDFDTAYDASTVKTEIEMARAGITSGTDNLIHG